jgi:hypothetical protein
MPILMRRGYLLAPIMGDSMLSGRIRGLRECG